MDSFTGTNPYLQNGTDDSVESSIPTWFLGPGFVKRCGTYLYFFSDKISRILRAGFEPSLINNTNSSVDSWPWQKPYLQNGIDTTKWTINSFVTSPGSAKRFFFSVLSGSFLLLFSGNVFVQGPQNLVTTRVQNQVTKSTWPEFARLTISVL